MCDKGVSKLVGKFTNLAKGITSIQARFVFKVNGDSISFLGSMTVADINANVIVLRYIPLKTSANLLIVSKTSRDCCLTHCLHSIVLSVFRKEFRCRRISNLYNPNPVCVIAPELHSPKGYDRGRATENCKHLLAVVFGTFPGTRQHLNNHPVANGLIGG